MYEYVYMNMYIYISFRIGCRLYCVPTESVRSIHVTLQESYNFLLRVLNGFNHLGTFPPWFQNLLAPTQHQPSAPIHLLWAGEVALRSQIAPPLTSQRFRHIWPN